MNYGFWVTLSSFLMKLFDSSNFYLFWFIVCLSCMTLSTSPFSVKWIQRYLNSCTCFSCVRLISIITTSTFLLTFISWFYLHWWPFWKLHMHSPGHSCIRSFHYLNEAKGILVCSFCCFISLFEYGSNFTSHLSFGGRSPFNIPCIILLVTSFA